MVILFSQFQCTTYYQIQSTSKQHSFILFTFTLEENEEKLKMLTITYFPFRIFYQMKMLLPFAIFTYFSRNSNLLRKKERIEGNFQFQACYLPSEFFFLQFRACFSYNGPSKKSKPILYSNLTYKMSHNFLVIQYRSFVKHRTLIVW